MRGIKTKNDFSYYMHDGAGAFSFEVAGTISDPAAHEMEQAWKTASSTSDIQSLIVDLTYVTQVSAEGRRVLREWHDAGVQLVATRPESRSIVASITGQTSTIIAGAASHHTWRPLHVFLAIALAILHGPTPGIATRLFV